MSKPMPAKRKATDEQLLLAYAELQSVHKVGEAFGMHGGSAHERLMKLGATKPVRVFSDQEKVMLLADYDTHATAGTLDQLAAKMGRTKHFICRQARALGLTDQRRLRPYIVDAVSARTKEWHRSHEHPRGMTGKKHTPETLALMAAASKAHWMAMTPDERSAQTMKQMKTKAAKGTIAPDVARGTWKADWREIGGVRKFYRSRWEANYARYLQFLKERGAIADWKHEPETFWFEAIKRGVRSYKPDFRVWESGGASTLHEVKGWMCPRSKTCLRRMMKYHPSETVIVIAAKEYNEIKKKVSMCIAGWE